jgi:hypothetical protein
MCWFRISAKDRKSLYSAISICNLCKEPEILIFKLAGYKHFSERPVIPIFKLAGSEHFRGSPEIPIFCVEDTNILAKALRYRSSASRIRTFSRKSGETVLQRARYEHFRKSSISRTN